MTTDPRKPIFEAVRHDVGSLDDRDVRVAHATLDALGFARAALPRRELHDEVAFYKGVRKMTGPLDQVQVDTIRLLLKAAAHWPVGWLAYGLATAWHEAQLRPIEEYGKGHGRRYGRPGARMKPVKNRPLYGGQIPYGRGLVQLTWCDNYEWADRELGLGGTLLANFDRALEPEIATAILVKGMETGAFTGRKLVDYVSERGTVQQFENARRIINGTDKARMIAEYALKFQDALTAGGWE